MKPENTYSLALSFLLLFAAPLAAQVSGSGTSSNPAGRHAVTGIVFTPAGRPAGRGIPIRLSKFGNDLNTMTDADGKYSFSGLGNDRYTLSAEAGDEFEPVSQRFDITLPRNAPTQIFTVDLQLRFRPTALSQPGVVDAAMAGVPRKAIQHYRNAIAAKADNDDRTAVSQLIQAITEYPDFAAAQSELGILYQKLDLLDRSAEHLRLALKLKPDSFESLASLGIGLVRQKKFDEGGSFLRDALKLRDDSAVVHFYLGRSLLGQDRPDEAERAFRASLQLGGAGMNEARRSLANIYLKRGENAKALGELESYLAANPTPVDEKRLRETMDEIRALINKDVKP